MIGKFVVAVFLFASCLAQDQKFRIAFEKCEIASYNKEYIKDYVLDCQAINDTDFKTSGSGELLKELNFDDSITTGQLYVHDGTNYVIKPQMKITLPICDEYKKETFGYWQEIEKHGNIKGCGVHQPGHYEVKDYIPKLKLSDMPVGKREGKYKMSGVVKNKDVELMELHFYLSIVAY